VVPLQRTTKDENALMAAYEGPTLAKIGLLKMDILGLTNLSVVADTLRYIKETTGQEMELGDIPLDDAQTFAALSQGNTVNVFQLESAGMVRYLKELKPTRVQDIYAMVALYRPGPLEQIPVYIQNKNNPKSIKYLHPILKPILEDTYGVIVYQEQIMQLLQVIAGYTLGQAYIVLKAIGKKQKELMAAEEPRFKEGCLKNGLTQAQADTLWDLIQPFAGYSFNRPHATLYGLLSYQTAYLKNNYPTQYMAAVLRGAGGQIEDVAKAVNECAKLGVPVLKADINASTADFRIEALDESVVGGAIKYASGIRFGLAAIKNVGEGPVEAIIAARDDQPFRTFEDFCDRVDHHAINKRVVESLIKAGAFDSLAGSRLQKLAVLDQVLDAGQRAQKARATGQSSLFDLFGTPSDSGPTQSINVSFPIINETREQKRELLTWEKELLGTYISDHPVIQALRDADLSDITLLSAINDELVGQALSFAGMLTNTKTVTTKKGDSMFVGTFEDMEGTIECVAFPKVFEKFQSLLHADAIVRIIGKLDRRNEGFQIIIDKVESLKLRDISMPTAEAPTLEIDEAPMPDQLHDAPAPHNSATPLPSQAQPVSTPPPPVAAAPTQPAPKAVTPPPPAPRSDIIKTPQRTAQQPKSGNSAPAPVSNGHDTHGPSHVLHIYFPIFDDHESAVQLMHEIYAVTEHHRTSIDGDAVMMIHLPVQQREVILQMRGTLRDPFILSDTLKSTIGDEAVVLESA
jgi:DNA polymerase-3 subunit alpha